MAEEKKKEQEVVGQVLEIKTSPRIEEALATQLKAMTELRTSRPDALLAGGGGGLVVCCNG